MIALFLFWSLFKRFILQMDFHQNANLSPFLFVVGRPGASPSPAPAATQMSYINDFGGGGGAAVITQWARGVRKTANPLSAVHMFLGAFIPASAKLPVPACGHNFIRLSLA
jgi:hypothetical protein